MRLRLFAFIPLLASVSHSHAGFYSGNDLHNNCSGGQQYQDAVCLSYVMGVVDGYLDAGITLFCIPETATSGQVMDVAAKYLRDNPSIRHLGAASSVGHSLIEAFPCT